MRAAVGRDARAAGAAMASPCSTSGRAALLRPLVAVAPPGFRQATGAAAGGAPKPSPSPLLAGAACSSAAACSPSCYSQQRLAGLLSRPWSSSASHPSVAAAASGRGDVTAVPADGAAGAPPPRPSAADLSATSAQLLSDDQLRAAGLRLPSHCCGCGMRLQRRDTEAPGYFIIPARLFEPKREQEEGEETSGRAGRGRGGADAAAGGELGELLEAARQEMDADAEADAYDDVGLVRADEEPDVLCQRCFSLKHSGKVKVQAAETALPDFDLGKKVGRKIHLQKDRRAVVLCVVDMWDFDGSLPRAALRSLLPPGVTAETAAPEELKFSLMVAANKFDLLPAQATPTRVQQWVRLRLKQAGLPAPDKVFLVSAAKGTGVKDMVQDVRQALGYRGDLWVVGAQNAGKSSLIAAMKRLAGTAGKGEPTIAPVPGTTLGLLQVPGLPLGPKHRAFDTPGVPHGHQLTSRLGLEDVKQVLPSKPLKGRTYRVAPGNTLLIGGGLARLDVVSSPGATLYLTVFVSAHVNLHLGKTEGAEERLPRLVEGGLLTPPDDPARAEQLPAMVPLDVEVEGTDWRKSTVDIAVAGLGWVGVGCAGRAAFRLWTLPGVAVTTHAALIPDMAELFERPGVSSLLPKAQTRAHAAVKERKAERAERRGGGSDGGGGEGRVVSRGERGGAEAVPAAGRSGGGGGRGGRGGGRGGRGWGGRGRGEGRGGGRKLICDLPRAASGGQTTWDLSKLVLEGQSSPVPSAVVRQWLDLVYSRVDAGRRAPKFTSLSEAARSLLLFADAVDTSMVVMYALSDTLTAQPGLTLPVAVNGGGGGEGGVAAGGGGGHAAPPQPLQLELALRGKLYYLAQDGPLDTVDVPHAGPEQIVVAAADLAPHKAAVPGAVAAALEGWLYLAGRLGLVALVRLLRDFYQAHMKATTGSVLWGAAAKVLSRRVLECMPRELLWESCASDWLWAPQLGGVDVLAGSQLSLIMRSPHAASWFGFVPGAQADGDKIETLNVLQANGCHNRLRVSVGGLDAAQHQQAVQEVMQQLQEEDEAA
ncbi:hypothetical protein HXX76_003967 [Chlamydomonas incerta]|uniref:G domain-containing protein n=1 Tax=Chlamydomonas incerta TaxID=51695 RepID=A0A835W6E8_CHLIN|nr:hypothetical protein HXX76_003967 [Chlamydomonas incerta]|eukprot:KAG2441115.1 hypothetical protein HXX76_003967 [Chlamydomonas incerta]